MKLKARVIEKCGSVEQFAKEMGISMSYASTLINHNGQWRQEKVEAACKILDIKSDEIGDYFFPGVNNG